MGFWNGRRVFITGHTGFKGGWLALWLELLGAKVTGFALSPPTNPSLFALAQLGKRMRSVIGDIRDYPALRAALVEAQPQVVFHLAAQPLVRRSYAEPIETYATNVMGTVHLLEAVRASGTSCAVVNVTSDKCYENREWPWGYRENEPMGGYDPYSSSKACAELVTAAYRRSYFHMGGRDPASMPAVAVASARAGNVIGGGDWAEDRLIPDCVRHATSNLPIPIRNPDSIRPWQHVMEPLHGYLLLAEKLTEGLADRSSDFAQAWNFGPHDFDARPVRWMADVFTERWGRKATWENTGQAHFHEAVTLKLDSSLARLRLGWKPRLALSEALELTVDWYLHVLDGGDAAAMTCEQIQRYQDRCTD